MYWNKQRHGLSNCAETERILFLTPRHTVVDCGFAWNREVPVIPSFWFYSPLRNNYPFHCPTLTHPPPTRSPQICNELSLLPSICTTLLLLSTLQWPRIFLVPLSYSHSHSLSHHATLPLLYSLSSPIPHDPFHSVACALSNIQYHGDFETISGAPQGSTVHSESIQTPLLFLLH